MNQSTTSLSLEDALEKALALFEKQRYQEALRYYQAVLQAKPDHPVANHNIGAIALQLNRAGDALQYFNRALRASPKTDQYWVSLIQTLALTGQQELAEKMMVQAEHQGIGEEALQSIYQVLRQNVRQSPGEDLDTTVSLDEPDLAEAPETTNQNLLPANERKILNAELQACQYDSIKTKAQALIEQYPNDGYLRKVCAKAHYETGNIEKSVKHLKVAGALCPEEKGIFLTLAKISQETDDLPRLIGYLRHVRKLDPEDDSVLLPLANALRKISHLDDALETLKRSIQRKHQLFEAWHETALIYHQRKQYNDAMGALQSAFKHASQDQLANTEKNLGILLMDMERYEEAKNAFRRASTEDEQDDYSTTLYLAKIALRENDQQKAQELAESILQKHPLHLGALGILQSLTAISPESALFAEMKSATSSDAPENEEKDRLLALLGLISLDHGRVEEAFRYFKQFNDIVKQSKPASRLILQQSKKLAQKFNESFFEGISDAPPPSGPQPFLITGMPRSGKSLLEKLLSQSTDMAAGKELGSAVQAIGKTVSQEQLLENLEHASPEELAQDARLYMHALESRAPASGVKFISETTPKTPFMPHFSLMFPHAPIAFVTRNGWDLLAACYFKNFYEGHNYSFDISALEQRIKAENSLIEHWMRVLPNPVMLVRYEDMVRQPNQVGADVANFLGVEWKSEYADEVMLTEGSDSALEPNPVNSLDFTAKPEPLTTGFIGFGQPFRPFFEKEMASVKAFDELC